MSGRESQRLTTLAKPSLVLSHSLEPSRSCQALSRGKWRLGEGCSTVGKKETLQKEIMSMSCPLIVTLPNRIGCVANSTLCAIRFDGAQRVNGCSWTISSSRYIFDSYTFLYCYFLLYFDSRGSVVERFHKYSGSGVHYARSWGLS